MGEGGGGGGETAAAIQNAICLSLIFRILLEKSYREQGGEKREFKSVFFLIDGDACCVCGRECLSNV